MIVYKIKEDKTREELEDAGFLSKEFDGEVAFICFVPQSLDGDLAKGMINIYEDPMWQKAYFVGKNKKVVQDTIGLKLDKKGKVVITGKFAQFLTMWRVQFTLDDRLLVLKSLDPFDSTAFCNPKVLEKYCGNLIKELKEKDLIEEVEEKIN